MIYAAAGGISAGLSESSASRSASSRGDMESAISTMAAGVSRPVVVLLEGAGGEGGEKGERQEADIFRRRARPAGELSPVAHRIAAGR